MADETTILEDLQARGIRTVLFTMIDQAGITRVKVLPVERVPTAALRGLGFSLTSALLLCADDHIADDVPHYPQARGDVRLLLDLDALRVIDEHEGVAWAPADQLTAGGERFPVCQRGALTTQVERAAERGLAFSVALELEFTLFRGTREEPELAHHGSGYGIVPTLLLEGWVRDLLLSCRTAGIEVEQVHPEYGLGQFEMSMRPKAPVQAVDEYLLARLVVARTAQAHGLMVSFAPIASTQSSGNGCHIHASVREDGRNVFADGEEGHGMMPRGRQLLGGLIDRLWEATALLSPGINSYERLQPGHFSGAFLCWGVENREASLRYVPGSVGRRDAGANIEVKSADNTANPYVAVAAIMACAVNGVREGLDAPPGVVSVPGELDEAGRRRHRARRLPTDLGQALDALRGSTFLRQELGDDLVDSHLSIRGREWTAYQDTPLEERVALLRWNQ